MNEAAWTPPQRVLFRFGFVYLLLYGFQLLQNSALSDTFVTLGFVWHRLVPWLGQHVLGLSSDITGFTNGSGDTRYDWVLTGFFFVAALCATLVWSLLARRLEHRKLHGILRIGVRYALADQLLEYGFAKAFPLQFPALGPARLIEPFGDASPMGLLWAFMGGSMAYQIFTGCMELLGGTLLLFRRTTTLGALVAAGVTAQVVALNFCYDVPVKLLSSHLVLMALFLLGPELGRLADFFVLQRPTQPVSLDFTPASSRLRLAGRALQALLVAYLLGWNAFDGYRELRKSALSPPLYGVWEVESFQRNGARVPPLLTDPTRWRTLTGDRGALQAFTMQGQRLFFGKIDVEKKLIPAKAFGVPGATSQDLSFEQPAPDVLVVKGKWNGDQVEARCKLRPRESFLVVSRGFHLINDFPFNR